MSSSSSFPSDAIRRRQIERINQTQTEHRTERRRCIRRDIGTASRRWRINSALGGWSWFGGQNSRASFVQIGTMYVSGMTLCCLANRQQKKVARNNICLRWLCIRFGVPNSKVVVLTQHKKTQANLINSATFIRSVDMWH